MTGKTIPSVADATEAKKGEPEARQRSSIGFPYDDLNSVMALVQAIHNHVGSGECDDDQLAAWTQQSAKSSGYRVQLSAARMFGLIEAAQLKLAPLGLQVVDPNQARRARAQAFQRIPLYKAVYEKFKGGVLPPAAALEREMEALGVASKMKDRARRVFERSAQQAGYFDQGTDRLVMPGFAPLDADPPADEDKNKKSNRDGNGGDHEGPALVLGLVKRLPPVDSVWPSAEREKWIKAVESIFSVIYKDEEQRGNAT